MAKSLTAMILVVLLSLATWSYFYMYQMPLTPVETSVVVGFWLLVVFAVRWILRWIGRSRAKTGAGK
ncbi:MAG: hypothetical protein ABR902_13320 [Candidatus Korobacteraceae bacterium]|jgi:hypothetical protein